MDFKKVFTVSVILIILIFTSSVVSAQTLRSQDYTILNPVFITSSGKACSLNYSLNRVIIGEPFGGESKSLNFTLKANLIQKDSSPRLSISINPTTWSIDTIKAGDSKVASLDERIIVLNDGNLKASYSLQVIDATDTPWQAANTTDGNDLNRYLMSGIFTNLSIDQVDDIYFNELGSEDLILEGMPQLSTQTRFATSFSAENGQGVNPGDQRALWLKFTAPKVDTTQKEHNIWVIIGAELSEE